jgi:hypothetical protein
MTGEPTLGDSGNRRRRIPRFPIWMVFVGVWLACGAVASIAISALDHSNQKVYAQLERHGVVVAATVTRTDPSNHNTVYYTFTVDGQTYNSADRAWPPNPEASRLAVGGSVYVVYDSRNPTISCACDPHAAAIPNQWWRRSITGLYLGSVIAVVITISVYRRRRGGTASWELWLRQRRRPVSRWAAPPNWPVPPAGWRPPAGWAPPPEWPPPPSDWQWWQWSP